MRKKIGIIGCGNISDIYFKNLTGICADRVEVAACSDLDAERSAAKEKAYGVKAVTTEELLADPSIDAVLNLTMPKQHFKLNCMALEAGKSVYTEKPLAVTFADGNATMALAREKGLAVGCAPDTFMGAGIQQCRKLIDEGAIGTPAAAFAFMVCHGHESWHPDPEFYYEKGGGPMLDMGPYYLTALVNLLGPVKRVSGSAGKSMAERTITSEKKNGKRVPVETPTHLAGTLDFAAGAIGTVVMSFDVWGSNVPRIEIHGTEGSLAVPDPNTFGGPVRIKRGADEWEEVPLEFGYDENSRGIGITDQVTGENRASGELALHVLEVMLAFEAAAEAGKAQIMTTTCKQPEAVNKSTKS